MPAKAGNKLGDGRERALTEGIVGRCSQKHFQGEETRFWGSIHTKKLRFRWPTRVNECWKASE